MSQLGALLPVLLSHPALGTDPAVVCHLLACSKSTASLCTSLLHCALSIELSSDKVPSFCLWFPKNEGLVKSICFKHATNWEAELDKAFHHAALAAPSSGLQLRSLESDCVSPCMLKACGHVTSLTLDAGAIITVKQLPMLSALTGLQHMHLQLMNTQLPKLLLHLPKQLRSLHVLVHSVAIAQSSLQWHGFSVLMQLDAPGLRLGSTEALPASLQQLRVTNSAFAAPLLRLQQLQQLTLLRLDMPASELRQLTKLTSLIALNLGFQSSSAFEAAAPVLTALPVRDINIRDPFTSQLSPECFLQLCSLSNLTSLVCRGVGLAPTPQQLSHGLLKLAPLQRLHLTALMWSGPSARWPTGIGDLVEALGAGLPALHSLGLVLVWGMTDSALTRLITAAGAATQQLTELALGGAGVSDGSVAAVVSSLTQLQALSLARCSEAVTDAVVPVIARSLQQLTRLSLDGAGVSQRGVGCLTQLKQLQELQLPYGITPPAALKALMARAAAGGGSERL